ncbi:MAG: DUF1552 domain-containing protein [Myxococcales bacterium]|nr:DUF1552 domain-containing protein [Myxococcales bacterium]
MSSIKSVKTTRFGRRAVLRAAGASVALPFLDSLLTAERVAHAARPTRFVIWFQPDGNMEPKELGGEKWWPTGGGSSFQLNDHTAPLGPVKDDLVFLKGVHNDASKFLSVGSVHGGLLASMLTGAGKDSIDQVVADKIANGRSLQLGVATENNGRADTRMSYRGGNMVSPQGNPFTVYAELFGGTPPTGGGTTTPGGGTPSGGDMALYRLHRRRQSVLDAIKGQIDDVKKVLDQADRTKLEQHTESIRKVESDLIDLKVLEDEGRGGSTIVIPGGTSCGARPALDMRGLAEGHKWTDTVTSMDKIAAIQHDLLLTAIHCEKHRVATVMFMKGRDDQQTYEFLPISSSSKNTAQHKFAHAWHKASGDYSVPDGRKDYPVVLKWRAELFRDLILAMKARDDGEGSTLFDNTLMVWTSDMGLGNPHDPKNMTMVWTGKAGGKLRLGRYLSFNDPHSKAWVSAAQMVGANISSFGRDGNGPLSI